jgi:hypothetical protein
LPNVGSCGLCGQAVISVSCSLYQLVHHVPPSVKALNTHTTYRALHERSGSQPSLTCAAVFRWFRGSDLLLISGRKHGRAADVVYACCLVLASWLVELSIVCGMVSEESCQWPRPQRCQTNDCKRVLTSCDQVLYIAHQAHVQQTPRGSSWHTGTVTLSSTHNTPAATITEAVCCLETFVCTAPLQSLQPVLPGVVLHVRVVAVHA